MAAAPLDGSPVPTDTIAYRWWYLLRLRCACGHAASLPIDKLAILYKLPEGMRLYRLVDRMRCNVCGAKPAAVDVAERAGLPGTP